MPFKGQCNGNWLIFILFSGFCKNCFTIVKSHFTGISIYYDNFSIYYDNRLNVYLYRIRIWEWTLISSDEST